MPLDKLIPQVPSTLFNSLAEVQDIGQSYGPMLADLYAHVSPVGSMYSPPRLFLCPDSTSSVGYSYLYCIPRTRVNTESTIRYVQLFLVWVNPTTGTVSTETLGPEFEFTYVPNATTYDFPALTFGNLTSTIIPIELSSECLVAFKCSSIYEQDGATGRWASTVEKIEYFAHIKSRQDISVLTTAGSVFQYWKGTYTAQAVTNQYFTWKARIHAIVKGAGGYYVLGNLNPYLNFTPVEDNYPTPSTVLAADYSNSSVLGVGNIDQQLYYCDENFVELSSVQRTGDYLILDAVDTVHVAETPTTLVFHAMHLGISSINCTSYIINKTTGVASSSTVVYSTTNHNLTQPLNSDGTRYGINARPDIVSKFTPGSPASTVSVTFTGFRNTSTAGTQLRSLPVLVQTKHYFPNAPSSFITMVSKGFMQWDKATGTVVDYREVVSSQNSYATGNTIPLNSPLVFTSDLSGSDVQMAQWFQPAGTREFELRKYTYLLTPVGAPRMKSSPIYSEV